MLDNTELGLTEGERETGSAIFGIALVEISGRVSYVEFSNNGIHFRTSIIWPVNCSVLHFCGLIEKKFETTKEGAKHVLSYAEPIIFI